MKKSIMRKIGVFMIKINAQNGSASERYNELLHATGMRFCNLCDMFGLTPEEESFLVEQSI